MRILHLIKHCMHCNGNVMSPSIWLADKRGKAIRSSMQRWRGIRYASRRAGVRRVEIRQGQESNPLALVGNFAALIRLCRTFKPDVIHAHMMSSAVFGFLAES